MTDNLNQDRSTLPSTETPQCMMEMDRNVVKHQSGSNKSRMNQ